MAALRLPKVFLLRKPSTDIPLLPSSAELMRQRNETNSKDDPEGLCLPMGTPRKDPYPWKIVQTPQLFLILYEGNVHSYRQVFLDGRPHDPNVTETWWGDSIGRWDGFPSLFVRHHSAKLSHGGVSIQNEKSPR